MNGVTQRFLLDVAQDVQRLHQSPELAQCAGETIRCVGIARTEKRTHGRRPSLERRRRSESSSRRGSASRRLRSSADADDAQGLHRLTREIGGSLLNMRSGPPSRSSPRRRARAPSRPLRQTQFYASGKSVGAWAGRATRSRMALSRESTPAWPMDKIARKRRATTRPCAT